METIETGVPRSNPSEPVHRGSKRRINDAIRLTPDDSTRRRARRGKLEKW